MVVSGGFCAGLRFEIQFPGAKDAKVTRKTLKEYRRIALKIVLLAQVDVFCEFSFSRLSRNFRAFRDRKFGFQLPAFLAKPQANCASGFAPAADATACADEAVPVSTRLAMPCKMAAKRKAL